ncbi:MAG: hypothetical protein HYY13_11200 [Nitrospirae bacterium]|nr:hypothetical protein [Nitrospirota bacterium]
MRVIIHVRLRRSFHPLLTAVLLAGALPLASCSDTDESETYTFPARIGGADAHHFLVGGSEVEGQSLLVTEVGWRQMYDAILALDAEPGDNIQPGSDGNWQEALSEGSALDLSLTWEENGTTRTMTLDEFLGVSSGSTGAALRFTGNDKVGRSENPGHRLCLVSCPYGVASNGDLPFSAAERESFRAAASAPPAGAAVQMTAGVRAGVRGGVRGGVRAAPTR